MWWAVALSAASKFMGGLSSSRASRQQQRIQQLNAALVRRQGRIEGEKIRRTGRRVLGDMRASYGASGVTMDGSPSDVVAASVMEIERDVINNTFSRELEAMGFDISANAYGRQARDSRTAGFVGAASEIFMGIK